MIRRSFLIGSVATPAIIGLGTNKLIAQDVMLDCGDPNSELCRMEDDTRKAMMRKYNAWEKSLPSLGVKIHAPFKKEYPYAVVRKADAGPIKLTRTKIVGNSSASVYKILVKPLPDWNQKTASRAHVDIWRKRGFGGTKNIAENVSCYGRALAKGGRSYRVGGFSTHCVVMYMIEDAQIFTGANYPKGDPKTCKA